MIAEFNLSEARLLVGLASELSELPQVSTAPSHTIVLDHGQAVGIEETLTKSIKPEKTERIRTSRAKAQRDKVCALKSCRKEFHDDTNTNCRKFCSDECKKANERRRNSTYRKEARHTVDTPKVTPAERAAVIDSPRHPSREDRLDLIRQANERARAAAAEDNG